MLSSDPYKKVAVLGKEKYEYRTSVARRSLNTIWNDSFRVEKVDDLFASVQRIQFTLMDSDKASKDHWLGQIAIVTDQKPNTDYTTPTKLCQAALRTDRTYSDCAGG